MDGEWDSSWYDWLHLAAVRIARSNFAPLCMASFIITADRIAPEHAAEALDAVFLKLFIHTQCVPAARGPLDRWQSDQNAFLVSHGLLSPASRHCLSAFAQRAVGFRSDTAANCIRDVLGYAFALRPVSTLE
jgi:hypothetical protein